MVHEVHRLFQLLKTIDTDITLGDRGIIAHRHMPLAGFTGSEPFCTDRVGGIGIDRIALRVFKRALDLDELDRLGTVVCDGSVCIGVASAGGRRDLHIRDREKQTGQIISARRGILIVYQGMAVAVVAAIGVRVRTICDRTFVRITVVKSLDCLVLAARIVTLAGSADDNHDDCNDQDCQSTKDDRLMRLDPACRFYD